jgi:hypothetical protein
VCNYEAKNSNENETNRILSSTWQESLNLSTGTAHALINMAQNTKVRAAMLGDK